MGLIIRQSIKSARWSYLGIFVGFINLGIIMPRFFNPSQIGLVQIFAALSLMISQFSTLGFINVINRLFSIFRNPQKQHNGFLFLVMTTGLLGFVLSTVGFFILKPWIIETNIEKSPLLVDYLWMMIPLVLMRLLFLLLDNYNKMLYDAVTGIFWMEFMHKAINLMLIVMFAFSWINFSQFFLGYVISLSLPVVPVIYVLIRKGAFSLKPQLEFIQKPLFREISSVMLFGFLNGFAGVVLLNVDKLFVNQYLSLDEVGIFGVCALFATIFRVPYNSISKIATSVIAEAWKSNDREHIQEIYRKSTLNQAIIGILIFVVIVVNLHNIFTILPPAYSSGKWVLVFYSAGMLMNTIFGLAGNITETSKYYRFTTLFLGFSVLVQFGLSILLIPRMGITGAALATVITLVVNTSFQVILQHFAFGINSVSLKLLSVFGIGLLSFGIGWLLPHLSLVIDIIIRSGLVITIFLGLTLGFKLSEDLNHIIITIFKKFR